MKLDADTVVQVLADVLEKKFRAQCERRKSFPWLKCDGKRLIATACFGPPLNCLFEFDPATRFNRDRGQTLETYPHDAPLGFNFPLYKRLCTTSRVRSNDLTRRRASQDAALDLLPPKHGLNPTLRLAEPEIRGKIVGRLTEEKLQAALESLLEKRFSVHAGTTFLQLLEHPSGKPFLPRIGV